MQKPSPLTELSIAFETRPRSPSVRIPLQFSERRILLLFGDLVSILAALAVSIELWRFLRPTFVGTSTEIVSQYLGWLVAFPSIWVLLMIVAGGYDLRASASLDRIFRRLGAVVGGFFAGYLILFFLLANQPTSYYSIPGLGEVQAVRILPVLFAVFAFMLEAGWRWLYATQFTKGQFQRRLLVVGAGGAGNTFLETFREENPVSTTQVIGLIDDDTHKQNALVAGCRVLGSHEDLVSIALQHNIDELVLAISQDLSGGMFQAIMDCFERGIQVTPMPVMYEKLTGRVPVEHVGKHWYVSLPIGAVPPGHMYRIFQRLFDLMVAAGGLGLVALLIPLIALANMLWSPGPLFYWQQRVGKSGRPYMMVKFRSMVPDAEKASGAVWAAARDPRVTMFGSFLRKSRIDELPQFWNVLKGEMSLIGPRPERPEFVSQLAESIPFYRSRHAIRPGLTGWAQVRYQYGASVEDALIKLQYDLYYIKHQSVWLDLLILYKTVRVIVGLKGR